MIDPKLNEIPVPRVESTKSALEEEQGAKVPARPRTGLSISDTIAAETNMSVGGRGVDTSGIEAGTGAGGGMTNSTPAPRGGSPATTIVGGARGSGTTPRADTGTAEQTGVTSTVSTTETSGSVSEEGSSLPSSQAIGQRAYEIWIERGRPDHSSEENWHQAERELRSQGSVRRTLSATV